MRKLTGIKAISFDMDGTLVFSDMSVEQFYYKIFHKLGLSFSLEQISSVYNEIHQWWKLRFLSGLQRTRDAWIEFDYRFLKGLGAEGDLCKLAEKMQIYAQDYLNIAEEKLYPETIVVLNRLKEQDLQFCIVSHRPLNITQKSLQKHDIEHYFQFVFSPETTNAKGGKAGSEMWQFVLNKMKVKSSMLLHIDDEVEWAQGARDVGIQTLLIDRKNKYNSLNDFKIHDLTDVLEFI
jgi:FMN phosphatase YigB (HAD superfamily)